MTAMTNYLENELLDHILGTGAYTAPANVYVKLHTGDPGEDAANSAATEATRIQASFAVASGLSSVSNAVASWTSVAAAETYSHFSIWDASTAGNPLFYGALTAGVTVDTNDDFDIASGDLSVTFSGGFTTFSANELLDHILRGETWTMPTGQFVKLHTGAPGVDAANNPAGETTREDAGAFGAASAGSASNTGLFGWTNVSTAETYSHYSVHDASTAGNPLIQGALTTSKTVAIGDNAEFAASAMVINAQ